MLRALACAPPGAARWTGPPLVERRALAFDSTCSHRPSRPSAWRAMPRVWLDAGLPAPEPWHRFTLTRLPEPSVLAPFGTDLAESSWGGPRSFGSSTTAPLPVLRPSGGFRTRSPRCTAHRLRVAPCPADTPAGLRLPRPPEGGRGPGLTRRPSRSPVTCADSSSPPSPRGGPTARFEVAVNSVRVPAPLSPPERRGLGRSPLLTAPSACALRNEHQ